MTTTIGPLHYSDARAVQIREPEDLATVHSGVHSDVAIYTDTRLETDAILAAWPDIMQAASDKAVEILAAVPAVQVSEAPPVPDLVTPPTPERPPKVEPYKGTAK
jgi:hypothetical protein